MSKFETPREFHAPSFEEMRYYERRAHELRAQELSHLIRAGFAWLRDALHIGHHHGTPVAH